MSQSAIRQIFSDRRILSACLLRFLEVGAYVNTVGYVNLALMSQYSAHVLPYYYFFQAILAVFIIGVSINVIHKKPTLYTNLYYITTGIAFIVSYILLSFNFYEVVFPTCVLLSVLSFQNAAIIGNTISLAFDIRTFIRISNWLIIGAGIGGITFGIILPFFIDLFGGEILLIVNSLLLFGCFGLTTQLKPLYSTVERKTNKTQPLKNSFFRLLLSQKIIFLVIMILMDYLFKLVLQQNFDKNMIGKISIVFTGLTSFILILNSFYGDFLVKRYGVASTLILFPLFTVLTGPIVILFPLWLSVVITYGVLEVLYEGTCYIGFQALLNTIPRKMQIVARTQLSLLALIIGEAAIAVTILSLLGTHASVTVIVLICIGFGIVSLILMQRVRAGYSVALGKRVEQQRYLQYEDLYALKKNIKKSINEVDLNEIIPLIGHEYSVYEILRYFENIQIDPVPYLIENLETTRDIVNFESRVSLLGKVSSNSAEEAFILLLQSQSLLLPNFVAQALANRAMHFKFGEALHKAVMDKIQNESKYIRDLKSILQVDFPEFLYLEIKSRLNLALQRFFYYYAAVSNTRKILNALPNLLDQIFLKTDQVRQGDAIEFIETITKNLTLEKLLRDTLESKPAKISEAKIQEIINLDSWLQYLHTMKQFTPGKKMNTNEKILFLRKVKLFESLSYELLEFITYLLHEVSFKQNDIIFKQGDIADQVYFIVSGTVLCEEDGRFVNEISQFGMFGEIGLLDNSPRRMTIIAKSDLVLLTIEKQEFNQLLEDIPLLSKVIILQLISYLRKYEQKT